MNKFNVGDIVRRCESVYQKNYLRYENISDWRIVEVINRETSKIKYTEYLIEHMNRAGLKEIICEAQLIGEMGDVDGRQLTIQSWK